MGAFLAPPPPGLASDRDLVIDYAVKDAGPVIRQEIWTPKKPSDKVRRVDHEQLNPPIFFIREEGGDLGLPLIEAAEGSCVSLRGAEEAAPVDAGTHSTHAQIRIKWCGYLHLDWNEQISIQRQTEKKETISLETFAKHVGRKVLKYLIGDQHITPRDIILIGAVHVSKGSWMPILQLNDEGWYAQVM
ncbi:hypothetical protein BJV77DRAFT_952939 [Russula vinacea]|nr:hypothetical protein BJV77DRAFT_952939 [Russula vinacea]